jgi:hypothetical protein
MYRMCIPVSVCFSSASVVTMVVLPVPGGPITNRGRSLRS